MAVNEPNDIDKKVAAMLGQASMGSVPAAPVSQEAPPESNPALPPETTAEPPVREPSKIGKLWSKVAAKLFPSARAPNGIDDGIVFRKGKPSEAAKPSHGIDSGPIFRESKEPSPQPSKHGIDSGVVFREGKEPPPVKGIDAGTVFRAEVTPKPKTIDTAPRLVKVDSPKPEPQSDAKPRREAPDPLPPKEPKAAPTAAVPTPAAPKEGNPFASQLQEMASRIGEMARKMDAMERREQANQYRSQSRPIPAGAPYGFMDTGTANAGPFVVNPRHYDSPPDTYRTHTLMPLETGVTGFGGIVVGLTTGTMYYDLLFRVGLSPSAIPCGLRATTTNPIEIMLEWDAMSGAVSYELWWDSKDDGDDAGVLATASQIGGTITNTYFADNEAGADRVGFEVLWKISIKQYYWVRAVYAGGGKSAFSIVAIGFRPHFLIPVNVYYYGGGLGSLTTGCSANYIVSDITGITYLGKSNPGAGGAALQPRKPRPALGKMAVYTGVTGYGTGFYDSRASTPDHFVLWDAGEVDATKACS